MRICSLLLLGFALVIMTTTSGSATTIDTIASWNGSSNIYGLGEVNTATFGQTFILGSGDDTVLDSINFLLKHHPGYDDQTDFALFLYEWDGFKATGSALFESSMYTIPDTEVYTTFTVSTGGVNLTAETNYIWFLNTTNFFNGVTSGSQTAVVGDVYSGGNFVHFNNGSDFSKLLTESWDTFFDYKDFAFTMELSGGAPVPEPATMVLFGLGLLGVAGVSRRKK